MGHLRSGMYIKNALKESEEIDEYSRALQEEINLTKNSYYELKKKHDILERHNAKLRQQKEKLDALNKKLRKTLEVEQKKLEQRRRSFAESKNACDENERVKEREKSFEAENKKSFDIRYSIIK